MTKKVFFLFGFVMVVVITFAGGPVCGSSSISGSLSFSQSEDFLNNMASDLFNNNDLGFNGNNTGKYMVAFLKKLIYENSVFDLDLLSSSEKLALNSFFSTYEDSDNVISESEMKFIFSLIMKGSTNSDYNSSFSSGNGGFFGNQYCNAANGVCQPSTLPSGSLIVTWPPNCGDNCYQGNGNTGSGNSGNNDQPPCVGNNCPPP